MATRDPRVDAYIAKSADFARPILTYLREMVHTACPDVEESLKWGCPHFMYDGMLGGMAAFKQRCTFGYWKGALIVETPADEKAMGQFGRITSIGDLPPKSVLMRYTKRAMKLNQSGEKVARPRRPATKKKRSRFPTTSPPRSRNTPRHARRSSSFRRAKNASTSSGSPRRNATKRANAAWLPRWNGWQRENVETGSTCKTSGRRCGVRATVGIYQCDRLPNAIYDSMTDPRTHDGGASATLAPPPTPEARERVVAQLSSCFSDDRLPLAEFERRVHTAYATPSSAELQQLLVDLIPPDQIDGAPTMFPARSEIRTVLSSAERGGAMFVPRRLMVKTVLGSTELDLTLAVFAPGVTEIVVKAVLGSVEIALPATVQVSSEGTPILGSFTLKSGVTHVGEPPRSIVRITGKAVLGSVDTWVAAPRVPTPLDANRGRIRDR